MDPMEGVDETSLITSLAAPSEGAGDQEEEGGRPAESVDDGASDSDSDSDSYSDVTSTTTSSSCSSNRSKSFTIHVGTWKGKTVTLRRAKGSDMVGRIKERMSEQEGTPADRQILVFEERELEDGRTLDFYRINKGARLNQRCRRYLCNLSRD